MTKKELLLNYRKWVDEAFHFDYISENGKLLPYYPFYTWVEFFTDYAQIYIETHRGERARLYMDYRVWCVENGYQHQHPSTLGIEYLV